MIKEESKIAQSWLLAAAELHITVITPYVLDFDDEKYEFIALIKDFGCPSGTLICLPDSWDDLGYADIAELNGFYCSGLYPESYMQYERNHFIEALEDWGYFGDEIKRPVWLTKKL